MAEKANPNVSIWQLIFIPAVITLAITILRLVGELKHWPTSLFNPKAGGGGSIIGITWLVPILGVYFALKLSSAGQGPASAAKTIGYALLGLAVTFAGGYIGFGLKAEFPGKLAIGLLLTAAGGVIPFFAWPALWKVLIAYGYAARIPVVILMYFAIRGGWGTHYDVLPPGFPADTPFWSTYFQIAFVPQMLFWIVFTIIVGSLFGGVAVAVAHRSKREPQTA
ncbi:MAG TPA: hypothetical protein VNS63_17945 [Blastocatellia bacterium]|nr:hypothetical protein [Blastocatellia bacterium]